MSNGTNYSKKSFIIIGTHGKDDPEKATMAFACANAAQSIGIKTKVFLTNRATDLARKNFAEKFPKVNGIAPLKDLISSFISSGGKIQICIPCLESRGISKKDFIDEVEFLALTDFAAETLDADKVFTC